MKKIWRQYGRLFIAMALILAINSIFYGYNLLPVLEKKEVLLLIAVTSMVELLLFFYAGVLRSGCAACRR